MSKRKKTLLMLLRGGMSQSDIAAVVRCSKRDVSAAKRAIAETRLREFLAAMEKLGYSRGGIIALLQEKEEEQHEPDTGV